MERDVKHQSSLQYLGFALRHLPAFPELPMPRSAECVHFSWAPYEGADLLLFFSELATRCVHKRFVICCHHQVVGFYDTIELTKLFHAFFRGSAVFELKLGVFVV
jgi:hypothetical protein